MRFFYYHFRVWIRNGHVDAYTYTYPCPYPYTYTYTYTYCRSTEARFAPYHFTYPALPAHMHAFNLTSDNGLWCKVEDFNWLRAQQSPNWSVLHEDARPPPVAAPPECAGAGGQAVGVRVGGEGDEM